MYHPVLWAAFGTGITCLSTVLGSATVLFVRGKTTPTLQRMFLGFAAGPLRFPYSSMFLRKASFAGRVFQKTQSAGGTRFILQR